jgi:PAS domain S-box-containing protein
MITTPSTNPPAQDNYEQQLREMNDALLVSSVSQHELIEQAQRAEAALRESQEQLAMELTATQRLQEISTQLIPEANVGALYGQILDAAATIMRSDMASMQIVDEGSDALRMLAWRGFDPAFGKVFESIGPDTRTSCSVARQVGRRVIVPDVETCEFIAGTPALEDHRKSGIRAVQSTPLFSRGGRLLGMISTHWREPRVPSERDLRLLDVLARQAADLIERSYTEEVLRKSEERFRTMADSSPIMIWVTDAAGNTAFLNRTYLEYFGVPAEQAASYDWAHNIHPDDYDSYVAAFCTALHQRQIFHHRVRLRRRDGQWRWFESRGNPVFDANGRLTGYIGSSPDITEIYEFQEKLKLLDQRKDEFLANMSHEIRSPLTGIMGYTDLLLSKVKDPEHVQWLKTIKESGNYLIEIVNDILDLSKIEAGKLALNIAAVSPHALLGEIQGLMDIRARKKNLPLILRYDSALPASVQTDRTRLRQIIINLVSNSIKFTERGGVEMVARFLTDIDSLRETRASQPEGNRQRGMSALQIEVIDTGIGITPEHQEHLFEPFMQADSSSNRKAGGTGLGLRITRRLVEMLGGSMSFRSEPNKGSTFCVTIPIAPAQSAPVRVGAALPDGMLDEPSLRDRHILVVDDREEFCYLLSRYIEDAEGRADLALNGEDAIKAVDAAAASDAFDAVVLDIHMPGKDGYEVARALRAKGLQTPIIALTAAVLSGDREKCLEAGCDDVLTKPIDRAALVRVLAHHAKKTPRALVQNPH